MNHDTTLLTPEAINGLAEPLPLPPSLRSKIDSSVSGPILLLIRTSLLSLVMGSLLGLICALKLVLPFLLDGVNFLSYGRLFPVAMDLLLYGWAIPGGLAVILWLMARLSGASLPYTRVLTAAAHLWNSALLLGSLAVLAGYSTSVPLLEYPHWASFILFVAFLLMGLWVVLLLKECKSQALYVSQWYLLAALCSFPWIYGTANMLLTWGKIEGSAQAPIQVWYAGSFTQLWLTPIALAITYYLLPKVTGVKIYSYYLVLLGFFSLLLFAGWSGLGFLIGGPIPAWMASAGVVTNILLFLPMIAVVLNFYHMFRQVDKITLQQSPALRFVAAGIIFYIIVTVLSMLNAFPFANAILNFTDYTSALFLLPLLGFFGMTLFGVFYYLIPRLTQISWSSSWLIRSHFWFSSVGVALLASAMILGGLIEGVALNDPAINVTNILSYAAPFRWLVAISWVVLLLGFFCFVRLLIAMRWQMIEEKVPVSF
ncbi:MAG: cbb3-type cytochrome c oxidase subunit I [Chthoniobacterales bacterium]